VSTQKARDEVADNGLINFYPSTAPAQDLTAIGIRPAVVEGGGFTVALEDGSQHITFGEVGGAWVQLASSGGTSDPEVILGTGAPTGAPPTGAKTYYDLTNQQGYVVSGGAWVLDTRLGVDMATTTSEPVFYKLNQLAAGQALPTEAQMQAAVTTIVPGGLFQVQSRDTLETAFFVELDGVIRLVPGGGTDTRNDNPLVDVTADAAPVLAPAVFSGGGTGAVYEIAPSSIPVLPALSTLTDDRLCIFVRCDWAARAADLTAAWDTDGAETIDVGTFPNTGNKIMVLHGNVAGTGWSAY